MSNVRNTVTPAMQALPAHGTPQDEALKVALQALAQLGDQLNSMERRLQQVEQLADRILRNMP